MCKLTLSELWIHAPVDARADVVDLLSTTLHDPIISALKEEMHHMLVLILTQCRCDLINDILK